MQSASSSSRTQRPYGGDSGQRSPSAQHIQTGPADSAMASQSSAATPRASSSSTRSQPARGGVNDKQLPISQIEKSVTHLLVATKQLLETLTQWSRKQASESEVSDVYVRLGYEFNLACRAFNAIGVDTSDLGPVPDLLRSILEDTLSQDASTQSLDRYLPRIRDIIINLLHGLKKKQARLRSRQQKEESGRGPSGRQGSTGSPSAGQSVMNQVYEETAASATATSPRRPARRYGSNGSIEDATSVPRAPATNLPGEVRGPSYADREASRREAQNILSQPALSDSDGTISDGAMSASSIAANYPPPPPPPKQDDALGALQRSGELERRASRRFSAYQIQKHLGTSTNGVPVLPTQNSPIPNRGRDVRESLNAVRLRGSVVHGRQRSTNVRPTEPSHRSKPSQSQIPEPVGEEEKIEEPAKLHVEPPTEVPAEDSPTKTPEDKIGPPPEYDALEAKATAFPRPAEEPPLSLADAFETEKDAPELPGTPPSDHQRPDTAVSTPPQSQYTSEQPSPGKELTLFLQYRSKIKKYVLPEGPAALTIGRLQLAFIEKFAWNTHSNGADLPEIYIQDQVSGVRHELEDLSDVKDRSVLVLNVDILDEVKKHFDDEFGGMRRLIEGVKGALDGQGNVMQRVSDRQLEAAKEMARLAATPPVAAAAAAAAAVPSSTAKAAALADGRRKGPITGSASQLSELQSLRRDLAVIRQTYSNFAADIAGSMSAIRTQAGGLKTAAGDAAVPIVGDAGRSRVDSGKKELADESERLVARVDDLQDLVEDLRKDVVSRGVRPLPRQLEGVGKDISAVTKELKKMQDFLRREKPIWTKIWEKELQLVCEERDQLTMQEDLAADLEDDLEKAAQTFALVEQATKEQGMQTANGGVSLRSASRNVVIDPAVDPVKAKDGVLGEVRALQPNHESRLEAIERAEKARHKELENRQIGKFQKELGNFVQEGKLKKSGGVEEAERLRRNKDDRIRKEVWERMQARAAEMEKAEAEEAAKAAAGAAGDSEHSSEQPAEEQFFDAKATESGDSDTKKDEDSAEPSEEEPSKKDDGAAES